MPALDGLRGIAIAAVMAFHYGPFATFSNRPFLYGYLGVDLFFVLSGFLISGILLDSRDSADYFKTFYARRVLRIFPVYYAFLALAMVLGHFLGSRAHPHQYFLYFAYLQNWEPGNGLTHDAYLGHLWSLAVEEQFYLFWPFAIWLCPRRFYPWMCGVLIVAACASRQWFSGFLPVNAIWKLTPFRLDALCLGALAAYLIRSDRAVQWLRSRWWMFVVAGAAWFVFAQWHADYVAPFSYTPAALVFASIIFWSALTAPRLLTLPFLRTIGKYSYAMYLFHLPAHIFIAPLLGRWIATQPFAIFMTVRTLYMPVMFAVVFGMALLSWRFLEAPFLRLKRFFKYEKSPDQSPGQSTVTQSGVTALRP